MRDPHLLGVVHDRKPLASLWYEYSLAAAGILSFGAAVLMVSVIKRLGGYTSLPLPTPCPHLGHLQTHLMITIRAAHLYGADFFGPVCNVAGVAAAFAVVHLVGVALALWAGGARSGVSSPPTTWLSRCWPPDHDQPAAFV